jgi:hypothetical protein
MASIRVVLATKTSALNAVYFIFAKIYWFARESIGASCRDRYQVLAVLRRPG